MQDRKNSFENALSLDIAEEEVEEEEEVKLLLLVAVRVVVVVVVVMVLLAVEKVGVGEEGEEKGGEREFLERSLERGMVGREGRGSWDITTLS